MFLNWKKITIVGCLILVALLSGTAVMLADRSIPAQAATPSLVVAAYNSTDTADADYICDGAKDQVQIQAAINALQGSPGIVRLLDGTFNISSTILVHDDLTLHGAGDSTLIRLAGGSNCDVIGSYGGRYERKSNVVMKSFRIDGNKANQSDGCGIFRRGDNAVYEYLRIENCYLRGLSHTGGTTAKTANNVIRNCNGRGIFVSDTSYAVVSYNKVYNCGLLMTDAEFTALDVWYGKGNVISYNYIEGGGAVRQLEARDTTGGVDIIGNTLVDGLDMGIAPHAQYARIMNNTIRNAGDNAIDLCGETDCRVEGNTISGASGGGQNLGIALNSKRSIVINNLIELVDGAGIQLGPDCNDNQILNNVIKNCGQQAKMGRTAIWLQIFKCDRPMVIKNTVIRGNRCFDDQSVKTQNYGVLLTTASVVTGYINGVVIEDNDLRGNAVSGIAPYDSTKVLNAHIENNEANLSPSDAVAPPTPKRISPTYGAHVSSTPSFDWSDVSDSSGVTYQLQIDNNSDYSSPILHKVGLTSSKYTLAAGEALAKGVYYWRVRAVDGAGNASAWNSGYWQFIVS